MKKILFMVLIVVFLLWTFSRPRPAQSFTERLRDMPLAPQLR